MESEDGDLGFFGFPLNSSLALTFGLGLGVLLVRRPNKPLSIAIKLADGLIKGAGAFRCLKSPSSSTGAIVLASKGLIKGVKVFKRLIPTGYPAAANPSPAPARKLRASIGAVNLLKCVLYPSLTNGHLGGGFLSTGHKFSKNLIKVIEGLLGFQLDSILRRSVDNLGLIGKAAVVAREVGKQIKSRWLDGKGKVYMLVRVPRLRYVFYLQYGKLCFDGIGGSRRSSSSWFDNSDARVLEQPRVNISELLSLSISLEEVIPLNVLHRS